MLIKCYLDEINYQALFLYFLNMPKKSIKKEVSFEQISNDNSLNVSNTVQTLPQPLSATREDYLKARAVIQLYRENQKNRPKRKCSDKQLAALAAGRAANARNKKNPTPEQDHQ